MLRFCTVFSLATAAALEFAAAPAFAQAPAPPASGAEGGVNGLTLGVSLDTDTGFGASLVLPTFFIGWKLSSLYVGGEVAYSRVGEDQAIGGAGTLTLHQQSLLLQPEVQVPIVHGASGRLEGYLQVGVGYGHTWDNCGTNCPLQAPEFPQGGSDQFLLQGAFGTRYFFDPSFALGGIVGLMVLDDEAPGNVSTTTTAIFEGLTGTAIF